MENFLENYDFKIFFSQLIRQFKFQFLFLFLEKKQRLLKLNKIIVKKM
jgi:hypothetical protein